MHGVTYSHSADCANTETRWIDDNFFNQSARVNSMNKGELIDSVAGAAGLSRADATKAVDGDLWHCAGVSADGHPRKERCGHDW